jgi:hypothetical protein
MCDPATIAGVVLSGASAAMNASAQSKIQNARDDAMAAERIRQGGLDKEAAAVNIQAQDRFEGFDEKREKNEAELAEYFKGQDVAEPTAAAALPTSASNITVTEEAKQRGLAKDMTDKTGAALGNLRSFGDLLGSTSRLQARDAMNVGQIGGFKRGSSNVLSYELDAANSKGQGLRTFADILGGVGSLATNAGLSSTAPGVPKAGTLIPTPTPRPALRVY